MGCKRKIRESTKNRKKGLFFWGTPGRFSAKACCQFRPKLQRGKPWSMDHHEGHEEHEVIKDPNQMESKNPDIFKS
jgi:hypothetical protein